MIRIKTFVTVLVLSASAFAEQGVVVRPIDIVDEEESNSKNIFSKIFADQITLRSGALAPDENEIGEGRVYHSKKDKRQYFVTDNGIHRVQASSAERPLPAAEPGEVRELPDPDGTTARALWQASDRKGLWVSLPTHQRMEELKPTPPPPPPPVRPRDPLILDLDGDKIRLVGTAAGIEFDVDGDGTPEFTGWPKGADDAFLVMDRNGDQIINNGNELFGMTQRNPGKANGFEVLKELDSNHDDVISKLDAAWPLLRLWTDTNQDGVSQWATEVLTLESRGILEIALKYEVDDQSVDSHRNLFKEYSTFSRRLGNGQIVERPILNIWFESYPIP